MRMNLRPLPLMLLTKRLLLLQWARSNMVPFFFALEATNLGRILELFLALIIIIFLGLLVVGVESKSTLVIGGFLRTQHLVECGIPFMTRFHVFLQRSDLILELFDFPYMVSDEV